MNLAKRVSALDQKKAKRSTDMLMRTAGRDREKTLHHKSMHCPPPMLVKLKKRARAVTPRGKRKN